MSGPGIRQWHFLHSRSNCCTVMALSPEPRFGMCRVRWRLPWNRGASDVIFSILLRLYCISCCSLTGHACRRRVLAPEMWFYFGTEGIDMCVDKYVTQLESLPLYRPVCPFRCGNSAQFDVSRRVSPQPPLLSNRAFRQLVYRSRRRASKLGCRSEIIRLFKWRFQQLRDFGNIE
jgi:hypothetical protein